MADEADQFERRARLLAGGVVAVVVALGVLVAILVQTGQVVIELKRVGQVDTGS